MSPASRLILASQSPGRAKLLRDAGIRFDVLVSDVDEDALTAAAGSPSPAETALLLAQAKAEAVAARLDEAATGTFVLGCDSVFELDGVPYGKPYEPELARARLALMSGRSGVLHTGHWLIGEDGHGAGRLESATVHFAQMSEADIAAYVATEEPLHCAGSFTIDGRGGAFIRGIEGDPHTVVGLSIYGLRELLARNGRSITEFWQ